MVWLNRIWKNLHSTRLVRRKNWIELANICTKGPPETFTEKNTGKLFRKPSILHLGTKGQTKQSTGF